MTMRSNTQMPPHSLDLNSLEHLWDVVEREIHIMDVQPTNQNLQGMFPAPC